MKTAEEKLINELAENGTDKQRELFLQYQKEVNSRLARLADCITEIAVLTAHQLGTDNAKSICIDMAKVKSELK